jgi:hypothetical protein
MGLNDDLLNSIQNPAAIQNPFSGIQAGRSEQEGQLARNKISAIGAARERGNAGRIRQSFARLGGGPRGAQQAAQTQASLGASAQTSDALATDAANAESLRRRQQLGIAEARGQFDISRSQLDLARVGQGINLAGMNEQTRQFDESQGFRQEQANIALQRQQEEIDFNKNQYLQGLIQADEDRRRGISLEDEDRRRRFSLEDESRGFRQEDRGFMLEDRDRLYEEIYGRRSGGGVQPIAGLGGGIGGGVGSAGGIGGFDPRRTQALGRFG